MKNRVELLKEAEENLNSLTNVQLEQVITWHNEDLEKIKKERLASEKEENKPKNSNVDESKLRDIELTTANDEPFYRQHHLAWVKNFMRKRKSKRFDYELAHKGIKLYYVKDAVKRYNELNDTHITLNKEEKDVLAKTYLENVLDDVKSYEESKTKPKDV